MKEFKNEKFYSNKKANYQMSFAISKPKNGIEMISQYTPNIEKEKELKTVKVQDFWEEKRKDRTENIIGTTLVNILNKHKEIEEEINSCKLKIQEVKIDTIYELYEQTLKAIEKYNIRKIDNETIFKIISKIDEDVFQLQTEDIDNNDTMLSNREVLQRLNKSENEDYNVICNFLKDIFIEKFDLIDSFNFILDIIQFEKDKIEVIESFYIQNLFFIINMLEINLKFILGDIAFIFNNMIYNFCSDLKNIYSQRKSSSFLYHKFSLLKTYEYEKPSDTFYNQLRDYYKKELDKNNKTFLLDICNMFFDSILSDLEYIILNLEINNIRKIFPELNSFIPKNPNDYDIELPRAYINYRENFEFENYKRQNIRPFVYTYNIATLLELYCVTIYHLRLDNREIHICKQCGRYFVTNTKNSEIFCRRKDPKYKGKGVRYCYQVGQEQTKSKNITSIKDLHHTLYNRLRNKEPYFTDYKTKYKKWREQWKNKEITKKQFQNYLIKELDKYNKLLVKNNKKEKRNRHFLTSEDIIKRQK